MHLPRLESSSDRDRLRPDRTCRRAGSRALLAAATLAVGGCGGAEWSGRALGVFFLGSRAPAERAATQRQMIYPSEAEYGRDLDVVVRRSGAMVQTTNREPRSFEGTQMWLNQQYVRPVESIRIAGPGLGGANQHPAGEFVNEHGEPFPVGGFLAPDQTRPLLLAELYDPSTGKRHRLLARPD